MDIEFESIVAEYATAVGDDTVTWYLYRVNVHISGLIDDSNLLYL